MRSILLILVAACRHLARLFGRMALAAEAEYYNLTESRRV